MAKGISGKASGSTKNLGALFQKVAWESGVANGCSFLGLVLVAIISIASFVKGWNLFTFHPVGMSFAFLYLSINAIQVFFFKREALEEMAGEESTSDQKSAQVRSVYTKVHLFFHLLTWIAVVTGGLAIYFVKERNQKAHLTSWHAYWGIFTLFLFAANYAYGAWRTFGRFRFQWLWKSFNHRMMGLLASWASGICIVLVLNGSWGDHYLGELGKYITMGLVGSLHLFQSLQVLGMLPKDNLQTLPKKKM